MTDTPTSVQARAYTETMARAYLDLAALDLIRAEQNQREQTATTAALGSIGHDAGTLALVYARAVGWWSDEVLDPWAPRAQIIAHAAARVNACPECLARTPDPTTERTHQPWCSTPF